ncbi:MAG: vWA domain-containing protein [Myxococcota bacterium]
MASACGTEGGRQDESGGIASIGPGGTGATSGMTATDDAGTGGPTGGGSGSDDDASNDDTGSTPVFDVGEPAGTEGSMPCEVMQPTLTYVEPIMLLVLDKSGSMSINQFDAGGGSITRWNALHNTVTSLLGTYQSQIAFGSKLFPSANGCNVNAGLDVDPLVNNEAAIIASIPPPGADLNSGGTSQTPVQRGMEEASAAMLSYDPEVPKAVMLILDGGVSTTCGGNTVAGTDGVISTLWNTHGIPTYVVGVDIDSSTVSDMNTYAVSGGVPTGNPAEQFYNATNTAQLEMFMDGIVSEILSCDIALDTEPQFPELTQISVDGMEYFEIDQAACEAGNPGWYWSEEYSLITLCGAACDEFLVVQSADVAFFCPEG